MYNLLLVEDVSDHQDLISVSLQDICRVTIASNLKMAFECINHQKFDLYIIDLHLPDGDGIQLLSRLESDPSYQNALKIIFTTKSALEDKILGFQLGVDEYMIKPINSRELRARVESKLRKYKQLQKIEKLRYGPLLINLESHSVTLDKDRLNLTPIEYRLLVGIIKNVGKVLSRDRLIDLGWGANIHHLTDRAVDMHMSSLRKKLGKAGANIRTVYGVGYMLESYVEKRVA